MADGQKHAIQNYRSRLGERGLARFEVLGRDADRDLIRGTVFRIMRSPEHKYWAIMMLSIERLSGKVHLAAS